MAETLPAEQSAGVPAATDNGVALIQMIERVALNPEADIDKLERLLQMQERVLDRNAKVAFTAALAQMQPELPVIDRRGNITIHKKDAEKTPANVIQSTPYALWEDINEAIRPLLAKYGFALTFRVKKDADRVEVTGVLSHREGHSEETTLSLPMDTTGSKNNVQAIGSSTSYGKRYTASALLNITSRGEDDDGKSGGAQLVDDAQFAEIRQLIDDTNTDIQKFCETYGIDALADFPVKNYEAAKKLLLQKKARQGASK